MSEPVDRLNAALSDRYRVERQLGQGGMATVFLAEDLKHERQVAIKVLKPELAAVVGAERFLAEIRTTAALQHPHILPLFDSGEADGFLYYVMPSVDEGESLRDRLEREKQLPVGDAVEIAGKVAAALDYAHGKGVVHRDIKPANILLSERGEPLVADFGIALAVSQAGGGRITETGLSLGTPHYMAPEQATGERDVDARSDVYALGCVLYEMLVGEPPFTAPTAQAVLARILTEEARSVAATRRAVPPHVSGAVARALEKLPADRFVDAADFRESLADESFRYEPASRVGASGATPDPSGVPRGRPARRWGLALAAAIAGLAVGGLGVAWLAGDRADAMDGARQGPVIRVPLDSTVRFGDWRTGDFDIAPDGSGMVFTENVAGPLQVLDFDGFDRRTLPGTEGSRSPLFSPDGRQIAYAGLDAAVWLVLAAGGPPTRLADGRGFHLLAWVEGEGIYGTGLEGGFRIGLDGSEEPLLEEGSQRARQARPLPGGDALLFTAGLFGTDLRVALKDLETGEVVDLVERAFDAWYAPTGHLIWGRPDHTVVAAPFDLERREITGPTRVVLDSVLADPVVGDMAFQLGEDGSAVYATGSPAASQLERQVAFVEPAAGGTTETPPASIGRGVHPDVSPDGRSLAYAGVGIWIVDLVTGRQDLLTAGEEAYVSRPRWSPTGDAIAYSTTVESRGATDVVVHLLDGSGEARVLRLTGTTDVAWSWTPDGRSLLVSRFEPGPGGDADLVVVDPASGATTPYLDSPYREQFGRISPDGRWAAFTWNESSVPRVYVRSFPDPGPAAAISPPGRAVTDAPVWAPDGRTLYFTLGDSIHAASVDGSGEEFTVEVVRPVRSLDTEEGRIEPPYSVHPDGRLVTLLGPADADGPDESTIRRYLVVNWLRKLTELMGEGGG